MKYLTLRILCPPKRNQDHAHEVSWDGKQDKLDKKIQITLKEKQEPFNQEMRHDRNFSSNNYQMDPDFTRPTKGNRDRRQVRSR